MTENFQAQIHAEVCRQLGAAIIEVTQLRATVNALQSENNDLKEQLENETIRSAEKS